MSSELESSPGESPNRGAFGHTTIRAYGAAVPRTWGPDLEHGGWGTGLALSYGVARAAQVSLELAYYRFKIMETVGLDVDGYTSSSRQEVRQTTMSLELKSPNSWIRPSFGVGFGVYEMTETRNESSYFSHYRFVQSGTRLGVNWGVGVSAQLDQRIALDLTGRYHHSFGRVFLTNDQYMDGARLLSVQTGLSYVIH